MNAQVKLAVALKAGPAGVRDREYSDPLGDRLPSRDPNVIDPATQRFVLAPFLVVRGTEQALVFVALRA
jgi:hypothetical protein